MVCACCNLCPSGGACCVGGECVDGVSQAECASLGGTWQGCCVRCHPTFNTNTASYVYPCNDTTTPTCCATLWDRVSQVVVTVENAVAQSSGFEIAAIDCGCFNGTYIFDEDDFNPPEVASSLEGSYSFSSADPDCTSVPSPQPEPFFTNFRDFIQAVGGLSCFSAQKSSQPTSPDVGKLRVYLGINFDLYMEVRADTPFETNARVAEATIAGSAGTGLIDGPLSIEVECETSCDDLIDQILEAFPLTVAMAARPLSFENQCERPSQATMTVDLQ
jgi:hypothetical protein